MAQEPPAHWTATALAEAGCSSSTTPADGSEAHTRAWAEYYEKLAEHNLPRPQDFPEGRQLYGLAAAQGDAEAQNNLGRLHYKGKGGPVDFGEARRLFGLAAEQGDADAQCDLGFMHYSGEGGPVDFAEARRLYGLAAAQGDAYAQNNLGAMHRDGQGGPKDFAEARRLFGLAAAQGDARAQNSLGVHGCGRGVCGGLGAAECG